jgi:hypothetical protein
MNAVPHTLFALVKQRPDCEEAKKTKTKTLKERGAGTVNRQRGMAPTIHRAARTCSHAKFADGCCMVGLAEQVELNSSRMHDLLVMPHVATVACVRTKMQGLTLPHKTLCHQIPSMCQSPIH